VNYPRFMTQINKCCAYISGGIVLAASILAVIESILRKVFASPTTWSLNLTQGVFIWAVFLGSSWAFQEVGHVSIDMIRDIMDRHTKSENRMPRRIVAIFSYSVSAFVIGVILYGGIRLSLRAISLHQMAPYNFRFPYIISYAAIVIGCILMLLTIIAIILDLIHGNDKYLA
jgi:TRAP-type C4-dicarboxylate transport system permease small subunit